MALHRTRGIVLKSINLSDSDRLVTFLTKSHGKVKCVAKGARKVKNRFWGSLEPMSLIHLIYFGKENQNFYVPFTAKEYLRSAGTVTIVRVLGLGGYQNDFVALGLSGSFGGVANQHQIAAILKPSAGGLTFDLNGQTSASLVATAAASASWSSVSLK